MDAGPEIVNINQADAATLAGLPGIGPVLAERIIDRREKEGPFQTIVELTSVPGLSDKTVAAIADRIAVGTPAEPAAAESVPQEGITGQGTEPSATQPAREPMSAEIAGEPEEIAGDLEVESPPEEGEADRPVAESEPEPPEAETGPEVDEDLAAEIVLIMPAAAEEPAVEAEVGEATAGPGDEDSLVTDAAAPPPVIPVEPTPAGRSLGWGCLLAGLAGLFGAIVGIVATLAILYSFNGGTLRFASADTAGDLQQDLSREVAQAGQEREALAGELATARAELAIVVGAVSTAEAEQQALLVEVEQTQADTAALEQSVQGLNDRITELAQAAENFVLFMNGLRDLLLEIQGPPLTATPTAPAIGTPKAGGQTPEATGTVRPTRTPRPTATPLVSPTPQ